MKGLKVKLHFSRHSGGQPPHFFENSLFLFKCVQPGSRTYEKHNPASSTSLPLFHKSPLNNIERVCHLSLCETETGYYQFVSSTVQVHLLVAFEHFFYYLITVAG